MGEIPLHSDHEWMGDWIDGRMNGWMTGWMARWMDVKWMDG